MRYAYLLSVLALAPLWLFLFWWRPDIRRKMYRFSLGGAIAGPVSQFWYLKDYWHPEYTFSHAPYIEDALFAFLAFGLSAGMLNVLLRLRSVPLEEYGNKRSRYVVAVIVLLGSLFLFTNYLGWNSIYASGVGFLLLAGIIWWQRPDLLKYSLAGGIIWVMGTAVMYNLVLLIWPNMIEDWWLWENISGKTFLNIPLEEFLWFGTWGLAGSVLWEWKHGAVFRRIGTDSK